VGVAVALGLGAGMVVGKPATQLVAKRELGLAESQVHSFLLETGKELNLICRCFAPRSIGLDG
jgi:hypothetical protein